MFSLPHTYMRFATLLLFAALFAPLASAQANLSGVVINEILVDPNGGDGPDVDTDGDGTSETDDEFVEFYNTTGAAVDISGWQVYQVSGGNAVLAHTFAASTSIAGGGYIAVVGAWDPGTPPAGIVAASETSTKLGFSNGGDEVFLFDPTANQYIGAYYNGAQAAVTIGTATLAGEDDFGSDADSKSIQRSPDGSATLAVGDPTINAANISIAPEEFRAIALGANEVPAVTSDAAGGITAVLTGTELVVTGRFDGLGSAYSASHLHQAAAGANGGVVQALSPTLDADNLGGTFEAATNTYTVTSDVAQALRDGLIYINIHTADNAGGEIRGQFGADAPAAIQLTLAQARALGVGFDVIVTGTVSRAAGAFSYIQADGTGLTVRQTSGAYFDDVAAGTIAAGTEVTVTGTLSEFNGLLQINGGDLDSYVVGATGDAPAPAAVTLAELETNGETYEGVLVTVANATFADAGAFAAGTNYNLSDVSSSTNAVVVRTPGAADTDVVDTTIPTGPTNVTGVVGEFRGNYQIMLIQASDLSMGVADEAGPEADGFALRVANPSPAGASVTLTAPVASEVTLELFDVVGRRVATLVDGPVLGEQTVRLSDALASGVYVLRLTTESGSLARTLTVVR
ncbi:MAG: hypothetical protein Rubg2KO_30980 [Rubricoccaceae bacterium]